MTHLATVTPWRLPERLVQQGTRLLTQQCWYWGCDVRRPAGNLLLEYGFARSRPPAGNEGSSIYRLNPAPNTEVMLWSFGVYYGQIEHGAIFVDRFRCEPKLLSDPLPPEVRRIEQLPALCRPSDNDRAPFIALFSGLIDWMIAYEQTISTTYGTQYRAECRAAWSRHKLAQPADLTPAWAALRDAITQCGNL